MSLARRVLWVGGTQLLFVGAAWWAGWTWLAWLLIGIAVGDVAVLMERRKAERLRAALADVLAERASIQAGVSEMERQVALLRQELTARLGASPRSHGQPMSRRLH